MKKEQNISMKEVTTILVATLLLSVAACSCSQKASSNEKDEAQVSQANVKAPGMDIFTASLFGDLKTPARTPSGAPTPLRAPDPGWRR